MTNTAEAQDEGAAGEPFCYIQRDHFEYLTKQRVDSRHGGISIILPGLALKAENPVALYTRPSSTPAADAPDMIEATATKRTTGETRRIYINRTEGKVYEVEPAADAERVREAVTIIRDRLRKIWEGDTHLVYSGNPPEPSHDEEGNLAKLANEAVAALNSVFPVPDALAALKSEGK